MMLIILGAALVVATFVYFWLDARIEKQKDSARRECQQCVYYQDDYLTYCTFCEFKRGK